MAKITSHFCKNFAHKVRQSVNKGLKGVGSVSLEPSRLTMIMALNVYDPFNNYALLRFVNKQICNLLLQLNLTAKVLQQIKHTINQTSNRTLKLKWSFPIKVNKMYSMKTALRW